MNTLLLRAYDAFAATISLADSNLVPDGVAMASMVSAAGRMMEGVLRSELSEHGDRGQAVAAVHLCVARATARCEGEAPDHWIQIHLSDLRDAIEPRYDAEGRHGAGRTGPGPRYGKTDIGRTVLHGRFGIGKVASVERDKVEVLFAGEEVPRRIMERFLSPCASPEDTLPDERRIGGLEAGEDVGQA